jgi:hypothetical protein
LNVKETPDGVHHLCGAGDGLKRYGLGVAFDCPIHRMSHRITVFFANPLDGLPPPTGVPLWQRMGEKFESLTLNPLPGGEISYCWTGFINNGEVS